MSKTALIVFIALVLTGALVLMTRNASAPTHTTNDVKNATYTVEGQPTTLINGHGETSAAPGSASMTVTEYFGDEVQGDLNGDGEPDVGFILTQSSGGSGTFYYVVAALKTANGYQGTNAVLLGDRIAPESTQIQDGLLVVNYADRAAGQPMSATPSVGVTKYFEVKGTTLSWKEAIPVE